MLLTRRGKIRSVTRALVTAVRGDKWYGHTVYATELGADTLRFTFTSLSEQNRGSGNVDTMGRGSRALSDCISCRAIEPV